MGTTTHGLLTNLASAKLGPEFWGLAVLWQNGIYENLPGKNGGPSPRERLGMPMELQRYHRFGCLAFHHHFEKGRKMDPNGRPGIYLGVALLTQSSAVILDLVTNEVKETAHYVTDQTVTPGQLAITQTLQNKQNGTSNMNILPPPSDQHRHHMYSEPPQELPFQPTNSLEQLLVPPAYATIILPPREARNPQHVDSFRKAFNN